LGLLAALFVYLGLFTWDIRTGYVDNLASHTGLEFARWVFVPGRWVSTRVLSLWDHYIYLVGLRQENDTLRAQLTGVTGEVVSLREQAAQAKRLSELLALTPPPSWSREGARIIAHRLGPNAALETFIIDKGSRQDVTVNTPVVAPDGLMGRVLRTSMSAATVLMVTDPNSKIPVISQKTRTQGILIGQGAGQALFLQYVPMSAPIEKGETLVTTGLAGVFPPGLPVATVTVVTREGASLFLNVRASALVDADRLEEVALLKRLPAKPEEPEEPLPDTSTKRGKDAAGHKNEGHRVSRGKTADPAPQENVQKKKRGDGE